MLSHHHGRRLPFIMMGALALALTACGEPGEEAEAPVPETKTLGLTGPDGGDYMGAALREKVEQLKSDVAAIPTDITTLKDRALVLYDWTNAFSLTGQHVYPDMQGLVAVVTAPGYERTDPRAIERTLEGLDNFVQTLSLREENPGVLGPLEVIADTSVTVDTHTTIRQIYTVGDLAIEAGGGFILPNHYYFGIGEYQTQDPAGENYATISSSNPDVTFKVSSYPVIGMFSPNLRGGYAPRLTFEVESGRLEKGDTVTVTLGDTAGGGPGLKVIHWSNSGVRYPMWIVFSPQGPMMTLPEAQIELQGGKAAGVHGFAPSIVAAGESFAISVRTEDKFRNRATGAIPGYEVRVNGEPFGSIEAGDDPITMIDDIRFDEPGVYRFTFRSEDGSITGYANPVLVESDPAMRLYWGETHGHTGFAEGMGKLDAYYEFARQDSRLDFIMLSEHDLWMDDWEWSQMKKAVEQHHVPGEFLTFLGYEWTVDRIHGGHHNVMFRSHENRDRVPRQLYPTAEDLFRGLKERYDPNDVLVLPHAHQAADWTRTDPDLEPLVEIVSAHGTFEFFGREYLAQGHEVGFIGASDDHIGHPGYRPRAFGTPYSDDYGGLAAVWTGALTRDSIFDALRARDAYATNGHRIILQTDLDGTPMGERAPEDAARRITGRVIGTAPIESVTLVRNGEEIETLDFQAPRAEAGELIEIRFYSSSEPPSEWALSRASQRWFGEIAVEGASLESASAPVAETLNNLTEYARTDDDPQVVDFTIRTRGYASTIHLSLKETSDEAALTLALSRTKTLDARIPLADLNAAPKVFDFEDEGYHDHVTVRRISPAEASDLSFAFEDTEPGQPGDSYYVRIRQVNGGLAWSSPTWIGAPRARR